MSGLIPDTFFMYLKKLYLHHKGWFIVIVLFAVIQITINIHQDASITPFFHYGMYSQVIQPRSIYVVPEIQVNKQILQTKDFSPQEWDNIIQTVVLFEAQKKWNYELYFQHIQPLLHLDDSTKYVNTFNPSNFQIWYKKHLSALLGKPIDSLVIRFNIMAYSNLNHQK